MKIGDFIKYVRIIKGISKTDLAKNIFSRNTLTQIENNLASPSIEIMEMLIYKLGFEPSELTNLLNTSNPSYINDLKKEYYNTINSITLPKFQLINLDQKLALAQTKHPAIMNLYLQFKLKYKDSNSESVPDLTADEIKFIYESLVSKKIHSTADYQILGNLIRLVPISMIENLFTKMFPVVHPEIRNKQFNQVILNVYLNLISEFIYLGWHDTAREYISLAKKEITIDNYKTTATLKFLEQIQLYSELRNNKNYDNAKSFVAIIEQLDDIEHYEKLKEFLLFVKNKDPQKFKSFLFSYSNKQ